jgi:hypothetical protein
LQKSWFCTKFCYNITILLIFKPYEYQTYHPKWL